MGMPDQKCREYLDRLDAHMKREKYCDYCIYGYAAYARRFLEYLHRRSIRLTDVKVKDVTMYLSRLRAVRSNRHASPQLRKQYHAGIRLLLINEQGKWPPDPQPTSKIERNHFRIVSDYEMRMRNDLGLAESTRRGRRAEANTFLRWIRTNRYEPTLADLNAPGIDSYIESRSQRLSRITLAHATSNLRDFLRYLHFIGYTPTDKSGFVESPRVYKFEGTPAAMPREAVMKIVAAARKDKSAVGKRDYAILLLISTYGLRAGEVTGLRIDDIDWSDEWFTVHHSKTSQSSRLPLFPKPGNAIADYLKTSRPRCAHRELFIRALAPYRRLAGSSALSHIIQRHAVTAGITFKGKHGTHSFRHARAISMLRAGSTLKTIGDVLGHRSARSTSVYLKLATDDLRKVALEIPGGRST